MGWELLQHLPYSPDLAPSNFHLFGPQSESLGDIKFKKWWRCSTAFCPEISTGANKELNAADSSRLLEQWEHCSELQGEYLQK